MPTIETLSRPVVILISFVAMMIIGAGFVYFQRFVGGDLLDLSMNGSDALTRLSEMDLSQRRAQIWITLIPDSLYPIAYGSFFAGATVKLAKSQNRWLVAPALVTVLADFFENIIQVIALNGLENLLVAKSFLTPLKFSAFIVTSILLLICILISLFRIIKKQANRKHG